MDLRYTQKLFLSPERRLNFNTRRGGIVYHNVIKEFKDYLSIIPAPILKSY